MDGNEYQVNAKFNSFLSPQIQCARLVCLQKPILCMAIHHTAQD